MSKPFMFTCLPVYLFTFPLFYSFPSKKEFTHACN